MNKLVFSLNKYRQWRIEHEQLNDEVLDFVIANHHMKLQDGMDREELIRRGYIILEDWCVDSE